MYLSNSPENTRGGGEETAGIRREYFLFKMSWQQNKREMKLARESKQQMVETCRHSSPHQKAAAAQCWSLGTLPCISVSVMMHGQRSSAFPMTDETPDCHAHVVPDWVSRGDTH